MDDMRKYTRGRNKFRGRRISTKMMAIMTWDSTANATR